MSDLQATAKMARTPAPDQDQDSRPLADTGSSGIERLRELEKLLSTARRVRKLAEAEISQGKNLEQARHRFDAANRMQRKVERELLRLRSELASQHPEVNQVWTPGDPVGRKPSAARRPAGAEAENPSRPQPAPGDFELSVMLGKNRARWNQPGTTAFDLQQEQSSASPPRTASRPAAAAARPRPAQPAPTPARTPAEHQTEKKSRAGLVAAFVIVGVLAGAGITFALTSSVGTNLDQYWDRARTWLPELPIITPGPASAAGPTGVKAPAASPSRTEAPPQAGGKSSSGRILREAPAPGRILDEERRLQQEARLRFEKRLKELRQSPAEQSRGGTLF